MRHQNTMIEAGNVIKTLLQLGVIGVTIIRIQIPIRQDPVSVESAPTQEAVLPQDIHLHQEVTLTLGQVVVDQEADLQEVARGEQEEEIIIKLHN